MAKDNNNGLYLPLSINLDEWEKSLAMADADLQKAMREMRSATKDLKLKYDVEIANAKTAGDQLKVLELENKKLTDIYTAQKRAVEALNKAYQQSVKEKGADAQASKALATQLVRESQALERTKQQMNAKKFNFGAGFKDGFASVFPQFDQLKNYVGTLTEAFPGLASSAGLAVKALGGIGLAVTAMQKLKEHIDETRDALLKASTATSQVVEHLSDLSDLTQLPINEVEQLAEACKVAGANIDAIAPALNKLDKAVLGGDKTLEQFGVQLLDAQGNLKGTAEQLRVLADAYSNMKALGRGGEFVAQLGKNAQALLPLVSRLSDADFDAVNKMLNNAPRLGTMLEEDAKYIGELDRALETLSRRLENAKGAEATELKINNVTRSIEEAQHEMQLFLDTASSREFEMLGINAMDESFKDLNMSILDAKSSLSALMAEFTGFITMRVAYGMQNIKDGKMFTTEGYEQFVAEQKALADERKKIRQDEQLDYKLGNKRPEQQTEQEYSAKLKQEIEKNYAYASQDKKNAYYKQQMDAYYKAIEESQKRANERAEAEAEKQAEKQKATLEKQKSEQEKFYRELRDLQSTAYEKEINQLNDKVEAWRKAGIDETDIARRTATEKQAIDKKYFDMQKAEREKQLKQTQEAYKKEAEEAKRAREQQISDAQSTIQNNIKLLKYIQNEQKKGTYSEDKAKTYAENLMLKQSGLSRDNISFAKDFGLDKLKEIADARSRLFGSFANIQAPNAQQTVNNNNVQNTFNFDGTVVEDVAAMDKLANKVAGIILPAIQTALKGETYGY